MCVYGRFIPIAQCVYVCFFEVVHGSFAHNGMCPWHIGITSVGVHVYTRSAHTYTEHMYTARCMHSDTREKQQHARHALTLSINHKSLYQKPPSCSSEPNARACKVACASASSHQRSDTFAHSHIRGRVAVHAGSTNTGNSVRCGGCSAKRSLGCTDADASNSAPSLPSLPSRRYIFI